MKKVFVGLSGGVDSAVSAALLKEQGYDVTGCFIKIWQPEFLECMWREDRLDAMRVAAHLAIPFREVDFSDEYKREVVDAMLADYARGITPNPDVLCNHVIKFGHFSKWARQEGADYIATGHYARVEDGRLLRGRDDIKDQSYFLWQLARDDLLRTLFPIGNLTKTEVRALAEKFGLPNAEKPDSQGLCFVGDVSMDEFIARFLPLEAGNVVDKRGTVIGTHKGAAIYTVGERRGFSLRESSRPHFVTAVDTERNVISVSPERGDACSSVVRITGVHWIGERPTLPLEANVQVRYRDAPVRAKVDQTGASHRVTFAEPRIAAPGQSLVMYQGEQCLGGGVITSTLPVYKLPTHTREAVQLQQ